MPATRVPIGSNRSDPKNNPTQLTAALNPALRPHHLSYPPHRTAPHRPLFPHLPAAVNPNPNPPYLSTKLISSDLQDEFNFGSVFVGSSSRLPLTLRNTSQVAATLMLDLVAHPDLQLLCPKDAWSTMDYETCPLEAIGAMGGQGLGSRFGSARGSRNGSRRQSSSLGFRSQSK